MKSIEQNNNYTLSLQKLYQIPLNKSLEIKTHQEKDVLDIRNTLKIKTGDCVKDLPLITGEKVKIIYSNDDQELRAYFINKDGKAVLIKIENLPQNLTSIKEESALEVFLQNSYAKATTLDNGDVSLHINLRLKGGMPPKAKEKNSIKQESTNKSTKTKKNNIETIIRENRFKSDPTKYYSKELSNFINKFYEHLCTRNSVPKADDNVDWSNRRFDSLARLIALDSQCSAVCFDGEKLLLAFNELYDGCADSKSKAINGKKNHAKKVCNYLSNYAIAAEKGTEALILFESENKKIRLDLLTNAANYYYKETTSKVHPRQELVNHLIGLNEYGGNVNTYYKNQYNTEYISASNTISIDATARARKDLLKLEEALTQNNHNEQGDLRSFNQSIIDVFKNQSYSFVFNGGKDNKVHAEMRIIEYIADAIKSNKIEKDKISNNIYIGLSKLCCAECHLVIVGDNNSALKLKYLDKVIDITTRGNHGKAYEWIIIDSIKNSELHLKEFLGHDAHDIFTQLSRVDQDTALEEIIRYVGTITKESHKDVLTAVTDKAKINQQITRAYIKNLHTDIVKQDNSKLNQKYKFNPNDSLSPTRSDTELINKIKEKAQKLEKLVQLEEADLPALKEDIIEMLGKLSLEDSKKIYKHILQNLYK